ncbi:MAG: DUF177 domain-containing protein [Deltaproteobacteria bacterium]|nr:DUF177 domain-containing protein [Deltaproteobacteria bacterium]
MKVKFTDIPDDGLTVSFSKDTAWLGDLQDQWSEQGAAVVLSRPVQTEVRVRKSGRHVILSGRVVTSLALVCSRCLTEFEYNVDLTFEQGLSPREEENSVDEMELTRDDLEFDFYDGEEIDVGRVVRENILLSVPIKPICVEPCRGLCPRCGVDLNKEICQCQTARKESKFGVLASLKEKLERPKSDT